MNNQVLIKAEQIARMIVAGKKATQIAIEMNMSYGGLQRILACPKYKQIEDNVRAENLNNMDASLRRRAQLTREMDDAVPDAMQVLLDAVKQKRDLKAALEVLDRDPKHQFTKTSRAGQGQSPGSQSPSLPDTVLGGLVSEAEAARDILIRVPSPTTKPAEA